MGSTIARLPVVLVIDLGLTNCKALAIMVDGAILDSSSATYPTYFPAPGLIEQDPEEWWLAVRRVVRQLTDVGSDLIPRIAAISVTGHMHALVALDRENRPLHRAIVLGDQRSVDSARKITTELGLETIYRTTGARMEASMPAAKIHWLKGQSTNYLRSVRLFTGCKDFIRSRMTGGDRLTDPIDACAMSLYDLQACSWSQELLLTTGITADHLPDICAPTAVAGTLTSWAAQELGLPEGVPVVVGSGDDIEVLGAQLVEPGGCIEHLGTTGSFLGCTDSLVYDPAMALEIYPHVEPNLWVVGGSITSAGGALDWTAEILGFEDMSEVFEADPSMSLALLENLPFFVPHLMGERCPSWQPHARGSWVGLSKRHTRDDLMRAAFVGTAFALKSILERIAALLGEQNDLRVVRRGHASYDWLQLRANVYGRPLGVLNTRQPTAVGAMVLGAVGTGVYKNLREATANLAGVSQLVQPEADLQAWLAHQYDLYERIQESLIPVWNVMNAKPRTWPLTDAPGAIQADRKRDS